MDFFDQQTLTLWLEQYGIFVLFILLVLGVLALPIPDETLMIISGALMSNGKLNIPLTVLTAIAGSICGITLSYFMGRTAGHYLIRKFKGTLFTEEQLDRVHFWFEKYGTWALFFGYFIPGVRHFTGLIAE